MKKYLALAVIAVVGLAGSAAAPADAGPSEPSGTIAGPFGDAVYGGTVWFVTADDGLRGWQYPMVALSCYQDVDGDGIVNTDLLGPDIVFSWLDTPDASFWLGTGGGTSIWSMRDGGEAFCRADLDAYGWKGQQQYIDVLGSVEFEVSDGSR